MKDMLEKAYLTVKGPLKVRTQKEKRRGCRESLNLLREYISNLNRMLVEKYMIKAILMRVQTKMWNMLEEQSW